MSSSKSQIEEVIERALAEDLVKGDKFRINDDGIYSVKNTDDPQNQDNERKYASFMKKFMDCR